MAGARGRRGTDHQPCALLAEVDMRGSSPPLGRWDGRRRGGCLRRRHHHRCTRPLHRRGRPSPPPAPAPDRMIKNVQKDGTWYATRTHRRCRTIASVNPTIDVSSTKSLERCCGVLDSCPLHEDTCAVSCVRCITLYVMRFKNTPLQTRAIVTKGLAYLYDIGHDNSDGLGRVQTDADRGPYQ